MYQPVEITIIQEGGEVNVVGREGAEKQLIKVNVVGGWWVV